MTEKSDIIKIESLKGDIADITENILETQINWIVDITVKNLTTSIMIDDKNICEYKNEDGKVRRIPIGNIFKIVFSQLHNDATIREKYFAISRRAFDEYGRADSRFEMQLLQAKLKNNAIIFQAIEKGKVGKLKKPLTEELKKRLKSSIDIINGTEKEK